MLHLNFTPFPELTTKRLRLRKLTPADAPDILAIRSNPSVNTFLDRVPPTTIQDVESFISKILASIEQNAALYWVISLKDDPVAIGTIVYWNVEKEKDKAEIGFELLPEYQGRGIMKEALWKVFEYGFDTMKLQVIEGWVHAKNTKSIRVLDRFHFKRDFNAENAVPKEELDGLLIFSLHSPHNHSNPTHTIPTNPLT